MVFPCEQFGRKTFCQCTQRTVLPETTHCPMFVCGTTTAGSRYNFRGLRWLELVYFTSLFSPISGIQSALQNRSGF